MSQILKVYHHPGIDRYPDTWSVISRPLSLSRRNRRDQQSGLRVISESQGVKYSPQRGWTAMFPKQYLPHAANVIGLRVSIYPSNIRQETLN